MRLFLAAASVAALYPVLAQAQTVTGDSEAVVVTATRAPTSAENVSAGVTVVDRKTIEQRGYTTLVDALAAVPGLRIVQSGGPGSNSSVFIRGTNSNQVLVLRDGVPVNDPGDPGGLFNFGVDTLDDVERIEVIRGPMSSVYGSGAVGGVINIITRHGAGKLHGSLTLAGGLPRQMLAQGDVAGSRGIWDFAASLEAFSQLGFDQTPRRESTVYTGERDGDRGKLAQVELGVTPVAGTRISLLLRARDAKYGYDEQGFDAGNATGYDASLFGRLGLTSDLADGAWKTNVYLSRLQNDRRYDILYEASDPNQDSENSRYHGTRTDAQWNNLVQLPSIGVVTGNQFSFGYEHESDGANEKNTTASFGYPYDYGVKAHSDGNAGYAGLQSNFSKYLLLNGQVREDATSTAGDAFTWRLGGVLDVAPIATHLKASYGTSFRAPTLFDLYGISEFGPIGNPALRPEHGQGIEAGFSTDLPGNIATIGATYFDNRVHDLFEYPGPLYIPVNIDRARMQGVEATATLRLAPFAAVDLEYTYTDARDLADGAQLLRRPYDQGSLNLRLNPIPSLTIAPELLYVGAFQDYLLANDGSSPGIGRSPSGVIVNFNVAWQATRAVRLFVWAKNIGNSRFEPANGYQMPGASFLAGARVGF